MLPLDTWMKLYLCQNICWKSFHKLLCKRWVQILCHSLEILNPETSSNNPSVLTVLNYSADVNSSQFPGAFWLQMSSGCWPHHHSVKHFFCPSLLRWAGQTFPWSWSYSAPPLWLHLHNREQSPVVFPARFQLPQNSPSFSLNFLSHKTWVVEWPFRNVVQERWASCNSGDFFYFTN